MAELTFEEYQENAGRTAIYPGSGETLGLLYTALGLAGEAGEVANKVKKILRDDSGVLTDAKRAEIAKEVGGVLWYCAMVADELGWDLSGIAKENLEILASRASRGVLTGSGDDR